MTGRRGRRAAQITLVAAGLLAAGAPSSVGGRPAARSLPQAFACPPPRAALLSRTQRPGSTAAGASAAQRVSPVRAVRARCASRRQTHALSLACTATDRAAVPVTVLEGSHSIDGFRSNYIVAKPKPADSDGADVGVAPTPIVLIHGFGSNKAHFSRNLEALASATGSPVYALDLLGHGQSAKPQRVSYDCSLWDWQVESLVKDVIGSRVLLVGHSLGGYIAMRLAARSPRDVAGLCVIAPTGRYGVLHPLSFNVPLVGLGPVAALLGAATFDKFASAASMRSTLEFLYKDPSAVSQEMVDALSEPWLDGRSREAGLAISKAIYRSPLDLSWEKLISSDEVREVVQKRTRSGAGEDVFVTMTYCGPVLAIWGSDDGFLPPETNVEAIRQLRDDPLCQVAMVDAGHCPHDERPEQVNALIADWARAVVADDADFPVPRKPRYRNAPIADASLWNM